MGIECNGQPGKNDQENCHGSPIAPQCRLSIAIYSKPQLVLIFTFSNLAVEDFQSR